MTYPEEPPASIHRAKLQAYGMSNFFYRSELCHNNRFTHQRSSALHLFDTAGISMLMSALPVHGLTSSDQASVVAPHP